MRKNYVLIDYENVQAVDLSRLDAPHVHVVVFLGANQAKVSSDFAIQMQNLEHGQFVKISGNGNNALDFHIAYYIGRISAVEAGVFFHIISKDGGFAPLISHLKTQKILAAQHKAVEDMPLLAPDAGSRAKVYEAHLRARSNRPNRERTLLSSITAFFGGMLSEPELDAVVKRLQSSKFVQIANGKVSYQSE